MNNCKSQQKSARLNWIHLVFYNIYIIHKKIFQTAWSQEKSIKLKLTKLCSQDFSHLQTLVINGSQKYIQEKHVSSYSRMGLCKASGA